MYLSHIKYILRDDLIHHLLKRQDYSTSSTPSPSNGNNGLITFSIVLGIITLLTIISGLIAYLFRRRFYFRRKKEDLHISHIANTNDEEYNNALDYYTNTYYDDVKDNKYNVEKQSVSMHNNIPDAPGSDITGVDTVRSKNSNRNYRIMETNFIENNNSMSDVINTTYKSGIIKNNDGMGDVINITSKSDIIINDDSMSDVMNNTSKSDIINTTNKNDIVENDDSISNVMNNIDISSNATDFINRESIGNKSDYSIIANGKDMEPNRNNTIDNNRASVKSNTSVKSKKRLHSNKQISQPTIMSSSIYNQERANSLANNLSRSATFNITRPAPPPPPVSAHVKPTKKLNSFESLIPSTFYYLRQNSANINNSNIDTIDSPTSRKSFGNKDNSNNDDNSHNIINNYNEHSSNLEPKSNPANPSDDLTNSKDLNRESKNNLSNIFVRHLYGDYV